MNHINIAFVRALAAGFVISVVLCPAISDADQSAVLRERIDSLSSTTTPVVDGAPIAAVMLISKFYEHRGYQPAWTDPERIEALFEQVLRSVEHGLNPEDFHARQIGVRLKPGPRNNNEIYAADTEILCTDAIVRLAVTLRFGKLNPANLDPAWNFSRHISDRIPTLVINDVFQKGNIQEALEAAAPNTHFYSNLRKALLTYRGYMAQGGVAGGFGRFREGQSYKRGILDPEFRSSATDFG